MIERREIAEITAVGAVGEMLGHFFDGDGRVLETTLSARTLSVDLEAPERTRIVAIAGGLQKLASIRAVLRSRRLKGLITDEPTARALIS
jgi:DNA-binding transcriptional regulator LsrR (DeoR family)